MTYYNLNLVYQQPFIKDNYYSQNINVMYFAKCFNAFRELVKCSSHSSILHLLLHFENLLHFQIYFSCLFQLILLICICTICTNSGFKCHSLQKVLQKLYIIIYNRAKLVLVTIPHEKFVIYTSEHDLTEVLRTRDYIDI